MVERKEVETALAELREARYRMTRNPDNAEHGVEQVLDQVIEELQKALDKDAELLERHEAVASVVWPAGRDPK